MSKQYTVWLADQIEEDGSKTYNVPKDLPDAASAAKRYAGEHHAAEVTREWPIDFLVRDSQTRRVLRFTVEREAVPEFWCGSGVEVKPGPHDRHDCPCGHPFGTLGPCAGCNCADGAP